MKIHTRNDDSVSPVQLAAPPDIQKLIRIILSRWHWIVGSLIGAGILCFLFLKLARPVYLATATIKFPAKQSEIDELTDLSTAIAVTNSDYFSERYSLKSESVVQSALQKLDDSFSFFQVKNFRNVDIYPQRPLTTHLLSYNPDEFEGGTFLLNSPTSITYKTSHSDAAIAFTIGTIIVVKGLTFQIDSIHSLPETNCLFTFNDPSERTRTTIKKIKVDEVEEGIPLLQLSFRHHNAKFAENFLQALLESYREHSLGLKKQSSDLSLDFIRGQLAVHQASLKAAATELELFKKQNQLFDVASHSTRITSRSTELTKQKNELEIQKKFIELLNTNLLTNFEPINYLSVGWDESTDQLLIKLLDRYNELVEKRNQLLLKNTPNAPAVKNLEEVLDQCRAQLTSNIAFQKTKNQQLLDRTTNELSAFEQQLNEIPSLEKNFVSLQSSFEVNQSIYSLLLNKEIESSIFNAGILPSFTILSPPDKEKIFPNPKAAIPLAVLAGLSLGFGIIFSARTFTRTFTEVEQITSHPKVNFLGILPHFNEHLSWTNNDLKTLYDDRSAFSESLKTLRTRLYFWPAHDDSPSQKKSGKQILITSDKSGEGKSFVALSLAIALHKTGKRAVLVGVDLRKSNLHHLLSQQPHGDLADYLENPTGSFNELIGSSGYSGLDIIPAKKIPASPTELFQKPAMDQLLDQLRQSYDYVILDTAPIGLVCDNAPALSKSDHVIVVIRWLFSDKEVYHLPGQLTEEYRLSQIQVVLNDYYPDDLYAPLTRSSPYGMESRRYYSDNTYYAPQRQSWLYKLIHQLKSKQQV
jgi:tyrosine-protein kinase Etk/Wzc